MKKYTRKPHIVFSTYDDLENPYYGGGGAIAIHEIARRLAEDFRVTVVTSMYPGAERESNWNGVRYVRIGAPYFGPKLGQVAFAAQLLMVEKQMEYDIWIESFTPPISTSFLPLFTRKPVIGLVHMLAAEDMERKYHLPFRLAENAGLKYYKSFIVLNEFMREKIHAINPTAHISVIPNGIVMPELKTAKKRNHILSIGRIEVNQKGLDLLLQAYAREKNRIKYPLYIAGSGEQKQIKIMEKMIRDLQLSNKVKLVGKVHGVEKAELYRNSAFVVCPSRFETFSMTALETMSYGKCIVAFDIQGLSWIPDACKIKIRKFSVESMARTLVSLSNRPSLAEVIGKRSLKMVKNFSWDSSARKYSNFLYEVGSRYALRPGWRLASGGRGGAT